MMLAAFLHPALFWSGLGAASVPVIIHLLNRRRFKILDWAAMRFLLESVRKNRRRVRLEELILLLLRCLAVFLLAVAVARFLGCAPATVLPVGTPAQKAHVFVLDDSVSMGQKVKNTTAFAKATSDLIEILKIIPPSDRVGILLTSEPDPAKALLELRTLGQADPESVAGRLQSLTPSDTAGQLAQTLQAAGKMFQNVPIDKRLYVLSDFRAADYAGGTGVEELRRELAALSAGKVDLVMMAYGLEPGGNLTAEGVKVLDKLTIANKPVGVQLRVRNNGPTRQENVSIRFVVRTPGGEEVTPPAKVIAAIDPGEMQTVKFDYEFDAGGPAAIEAQLPADTLAGDNTAYLALNVRPARKVLVLNGEPDVMNPQADEAYYLLVAIDPTADYRYGTAVDVVSADRAEQVDFEAYDAVIMANVAELLPAELKALTEYVSAGGGLAIFLGDQIKLNFYSGEFYKRGTGLCPLPVGVPRGDANRRMSFARLARDRIANDAVMRAFHEKRSQFTQLVRFYAYVGIDAKATVSAVSSAVGRVNVLARFNDPESTPAIASRTFGDGTVAMIGSSADIEWTDWPKDPTYIIFVNDLLDHICRRGAERLNGRVGGTVAHAVGADWAPARASVRTPAFPAEDDVVLEGEKIAARRLIRYHDTRHAGIYQLTLDLAGDQRIVTFARNIDPVEGRLECHAERHLRETLTVPFEYQNKLAPQTSAEAAVTAGARQEYWKAALAALLMVLAAEVFLGQRFGHYQT